MFQLLDTQLLENSLDASSLRQQVIANNIANLNTPGYQAQTVSFEAELRQALEEESPEPVRPQVVAQAGRASIHNEMASLAKNQIMYTALSTKISGLFATFKWVVENAGR
ncbi:MAG: flagellar basal body rod protein FlgB [Candidatus Eremiobacteraeota bacterium]|nr:flagellar basal body rod protein FlgB [Candidatus Eremiobacteraeota bacterium]MCW5866158.1 flagellar basal body rod protein FlgB [Candidatus Eremiobacteraeota bacterium]